jgi:amino acid transporter
MNDGGHSNNFETPSSGTGRFARFTQPARSVLSVVIAGAVVALLVSLSNGGEEGGVVQIGGDDGVYWDASAATGLSLLLILVSFFLRRALDPSRNRPKELMAIWAIAFVVVGCMTTYSATIPGTSTDTALISEDTAECSVSVAGWIMHLSASDMYGRGELARYEWQTSVGTDSPVHQETLRFSQRFQYRAQSTGAEQAMVDLMPDINDQCDIWVADGIPVPPSPLAEEFE